MLKQQFLNFYCVNYVNEQKHTRNAMKEKEKKSPAKRLNIRVRLDHKTIITIKDMAKLSFWKERYPKAVVLD